MRRLDAPVMPSWLADQLPFRRYAVDLGDHRIHVMEQGEGLPVLLFHGNPTWGYLYRKVAAELVDAPFRLIMPDLVGLGFSTKPRRSADHQLENHIGWMSRLVATLGLERCVAVVQDWGGPVGVGALADHPQLEVGLVVLNTVLTPPREGFRPSAFHRLAHTPIAGELIFRGLGFPQRVLWTAQGQRSSIGRAETRAYTYPLRDNARAALALARMVPDSFRHPSIAPLRRCQRWVERFEGPAAIVWGDRDPVLGRVRNWMQKLFPEAPITRTQAGHFLQEEVPVEIASAVRDVAARLEG
jgi:haloalkane dehalogenase